MSIEKVLPDRCVSILLHCWPAFFFIAVSAFSGSSASSADMQSVVTSGFAGAPFSVPVSVSCQRPGSSTVLAPAAGTASRRAKTTPQAAVRYEILSMTFSGNEQAPLAITSPPYIFDSLAMSTALA